MSQPSFLPHSPRFGSLLNIFEGSLAFLYRYLSPPSILIVYVPFSTKHYLEFEKRQGTGGLDSAFKSRKSRWLATGEGPWTSCKRYVLVQSALAFAPSVFSSSAPGLLLLLKRSSRVPRFYARLFLSRCARMSYSLVVSSASALFATYRQQRRNSYTY